MAKFKVTRKVTKKECPWLDKTVKKGTEVFEYFGCTYGCISPSGIACTMEYDKTPFFELPANALDEI